VSTFALPSVTGPVTEKQARRTPKMFERKSGSSGKPLTQEIKSNLNHFFQSIEKKAFRYALGNVSDEQLALDLVQDAMLGFASHYAYKPESDWNPLFYTILNNRIRDHYRKQRVRSRFGSILSLFQTLGEDESGPEIQDRLSPAPRADGMSEPESDTHSRRLRHDIGAAVNTLSGKQREVFLLREIEALSVAHTARIVGCSEGSVKQHHFRALRKLRTLLQEEWRDD